MTQLALGPIRDRERVLTRERLLTESAIVLRDLLEELGVHPHDVGARSPRDLWDTDLYRHLPLVDRLRTWICRHDLAVLDPRAAVVVAELGDCVPRSTTEARWHRRILAAVACGEYPSGREIRGAWNTSTSLGPKARGYRAEVLTDLGWVEIRKGTGSSRWVPPEGSPHWHWTPATHQRAARRARAVADMVTRAARSPGEDPQP